MKKSVFLSILFILLMVNLPVSAQDQGMENIKSMLAKARQLSGQGKMKEANEVYSLLMKEYPANREVVQNWLVGNMKRSPTGEMEAIGQLDSLGRLYPSNTGILFFKVFLKAEHSMSREAAEDVNRLVALQPDSADNWVLKGQLMYDLKNYPVAAEAFDKAFTLNPKRNDLQGMRAVAIAHTGHFDEAIAVISKGIENAPGNPANFYNRACIFSLKGDKTSSLSDLKKAFEMNPQFKAGAIKDEDLKNLWEDEEFKTLTK